MPDEAASALDPRWLTCRLCGEANPPGTTRCRICGKEGLLGASGAAPLDRKARRWYHFVRYGRIAAVVAVAAGLAVVLAQGALTPAPTADDPLTQTSVLSVGPGNETEIAGAITGGDYIQGNYTAMSPPGAQLTLTIYNNTEFSAFVRGESTPSQEPIVPSASSAFVFDAPYTDTYHFVWVNHYPVGSGIDIRFFVKTAYEPNVVIA